MDITSLIEEKTVFKSKDQTGDFPGLMFVGKPPSKPFGPFAGTKGLIYYIIFEDGGSDWFTLPELDIDPSTIRQYNPDRDPDFYGSHG